jgi:hypothetical protein
MMEMIRFGVMGLEEYDAVIYLDSDVHVSEFYWYFLYWMQLDSHSELRMGVTRVHNWRRDCHVWLEFGPLSGACVCSCGGMVSSYALRPTTALQTTSYIPCRIDMLVVAVYLSPFTSLPRSLEI